MFNHLQSQQMCIVTIDGPSGSGKGTIARLLAKKFQWHLLDSGLLYRALTYIAQELNIDLADHVQLTKLANYQLDIVFEPSHENPSYPLEVIWRGAKIATNLQTESLGLQTAKVAEILGVRQALLQRQRDFAQPPGLIADGRDMGTVIFPEAQLKFFLNASVEERAKRRYKQLQAKGVRVRVERILEQMQARDQCDIDRELSPLKPAEDAFCIDSTDYSVDEVQSLISNEITTYCNRTISPT